MEPAEIFASATGVPVGAVRRVERIKGGLTNASWLVEGSDGRWVLRVSLGNEAALGIERTSESRILDAAYRAGLFPEIRVCDPGRGVLVSRHLPGRVWDAADARSLTNVERLGSVLATVHCLEPPSGIATVEPIAVIDHYRTGLERAGISLDAGLDARHRYVLGQARELQSSVRLLCHNDVHHLNVIDDGRLWLLDWEYAGLGSPYFDLAAIVCYHDYDARQTLALLAASMGDTSPAAREQLALACEVFEHVRHLWQIVQTTEVAIET